MPATDKVAEGSTKIFINHMIWPYGCMVLLMNPLTSMVTYIKQHEWSELFSDMTNIVIDDCNTMIEAKVEAIDDSFVHLKGFPHILHA